MFGMKVDEARSNVHGAIEGREVFRLRHDA